MMKTVFNKYLVILIFGFIVCQSLIKVVYSNEKIDILNERDNILKQSMSLINEKKFLEAKIILKKAIQKLPDDEFLWLAYDNCIRSEVIFNDSNEVNNLNIKSSNYEVIIKEQNSTKNLLNNSENSNNNLNDNLNFINSLILEADFSKGKPEGNLACSLNETFQFIKVNETYYVMTNSKNSTATISFSFNVSKFPKNANLILNHKIIKKDRFLAEIPIIIEVNEQKVNYEPIKLSNNILSNEIEITNNLKVGTNFITFFIEKPKFPYLIKNVQIKLNFN